MDECKPLVADQYKPEEYRRGDWAGIPEGPPWQGLTFIRLSAQLKRILWDRGAFRGCFGGA